jgi:subtilase family serine protease
MARFRGITDGFFGVALAAFVGVGFAAHAAEDRIGGRVEGSESVLVKGLIHPKATPENDRGPVAPSLAMSGITINIKPSAAQQADLNQLLEQQRDPSSADYQKWLTPEEYGNRFGLSISDMDKLTSWLQGQGFSVDHVSRSMNWVAFSGTAGQLDRVFHTQLHRFLVDGESHFANTRQPAVPTALEGVIGDIQGLTDFRLKPQRLRTRKLNPGYTSSGGGHNLAPGDLATIYDLNPLYSAGFTGTNQKLVIAGQTDVAISDIAAFRTKFGLNAANTPQLVLYGTDPGTVAGDVEEADLDLEWSGAVAPNATIVYVYSTNVIASVQYAISQNLAPVISLSYGGCEAENSPRLETIAQQANAQGITWLAASGDAGAAACDGGAVATHGLAVNMPASIPEVTAVGGTEFNEGGGSYWSTTNNATGGSALSYIPEMAWNDSAARGELAATGGGASTYYAKPTWQTGAGVPADGKRDVPDVSLPASPDHDGYYLYTGGALGIVGGTSVGTPAFAGIVTLLNQYLVTNGIQAKVGLGNINPTLYHLAATASSVFHDVTVGSNIVPCTTGTTNCTTGSLGYSAGVGYDLATGIGSVDANSLVTRWSSLTASVGSMSTLVASPTSISSTAGTTLTVTVEPTTGTTAPTGSVTFGVGAKTLGTMTLVASGGTSTAALTVTGSSLAAGSNAITASYGGNGTFNGSVATAVVTVTAAAVATTTAVSANPTSIATTASTKLTATVKPASGTTAPTGRVTFSLGTKTLGTGTLAASGSSGVATLAVSASSLAAGSNTITATYAASGSFTASSGTATVTVMVPAVATTTTVAANPSSIANTASTILTATVKPASGTAAPGGAVTFTLGTRTLGTGTLAVSGSNGVATLTVNGSSLATGSNTITATYGAGSAFSASSGTVTVTATVPAISTTTTVSANPASIASNASTTITATVKPASATAAAPGGTVTFTLGNKTLGSGTLEISGSNGVATLTVSGTALATGSNTITVTYAGKSPFTGSTATTTVTVTAPVVVATTTSVSGNPTSITSTGSTVITATIKPAAGATAPTGSVTFTAGTVTLGTATLIASGTNATATLTVTGSKLVTGSNTVKASYGGTTAFAASNGSVSIAVTAAQSKHATR